MKQLKATDVLASKHVMLIAQSLMKLQETCVVNQEEKSQTVNVNPRRTKTRIINLPSRLKD